ncbi:MAG TPA: glycosyltransferase family 4 protein [Trebonia sp.]|jgi:glycosyltransferase involved in cell wall biosynthesis|nr:glycosyltransferase family 4 protein [Trebonia sp.]
MPDQPPRPEEATAGSARPLIVATMLRAEGGTGVHTHVRQLRRYVSQTGATPALITPFEWGGALNVPVFGFRRILEPVSSAWSVAWYRHWHEVFLRNALRKVLAKTGDCVVYAQDPPAARAALRARRGPGQKVVLAVHFRISQSDEWADKGQIAKGGAVYQSIRRVERQVIRRVDRLVYVSKWAHRALVEWFPEAGAVPAAVIGNFVTPWHPTAIDEPAADLATIGHLEPVKNHRYLFEVLAAAKRLGHVFTLDIFGEGPLKKELTDRARELGIIEQVRFRGFRNDMRDFLPKYRAYVHASYSESSSLAIIEAMDAGLPIVVADIGPLGEICDGNVESRFWPLDDPVAAARVLVMFLGDESGRAKAARAARERFDTYFNAEVVGPRLRSFLMDGEQPEFDGLT